MLLEVNKKFVEHVSAFIKVSDTNSNAVCICKGMCDILKEQCEEMIARIEEAKDERINN